MEQCARVSPTRTRTDRVGHDEFEISKKIPKWNRYVRRHLKWPWSPVTPPILQEKARTVQLVIWPSTFGQLNSSTWTPWVAIFQFAGSTNFVKLVKPSFERILYAICTHSVCNVRRGPWIKSAGPDTVWVRIRFQSGVRTGVQGSIITVLMILQFIIKFSIENTWDRSSPSYLEFGNNYT